MIKKLIAGIAMAAAVAGATFADVPDRMEFPAKNGNVVFFHNNHANEASGTCAVCHDQAPEGKIEGFGAEFAHHVCVSCHADPGGAEGPTTCQGCHKQ